ncbi:unnamed protein product [Meloidogyne enterolobii]
MFGRKPVIAKADDISIGAAMICDILALRFPSKDYNVERFLKEAKANLVLEVPDTVYVCDDVWKTVHHTIRLLFAKIGIFVATLKATKILLFYASNFAPAVNTKILIRLVYDSSKDSHHYGFNSGLPNYVIANYFETINVLLLDIRSLDHNEVRKGLEVFLKDVDRYGKRKIKAKDLKIPKMEVLFKDLNRSINGEVKKEEQKKLGESKSEEIQFLKCVNVTNDKKEESSFKLVKIPHFHQIINGVTYKYIYIAM